MATTPATPSTSIKKGAEWLKHLGAWGKEQIRKSGPSILTANKFIYPQQQILKVWRILDLQRDIHIDDVYVQQIFDVNAYADPRNTVRIAGVTIPQGDIYSRITENINAGSQVTLIAGRAGSGKSTLLRRWCLELLSRLDNAYVRRDHPIPIFMSLKYLKGTASGELTRDNFISCIARTIPGLLRERIELPFVRIDYLQELYGQLLFKTRLWLEHKLRFSSSKTPEWVFFCDGFDEMSIELRPAFLSWLQSLRPPIRVVISTRPETLAFINQPRSNSYNICDFNDTQVRQFVSQWFSANVVLGKNLQTEISTKKALARIASIPLLLTFLCVDVEFKKKAYFNDDLLQTDVIHRILEVIIDHWDASKDGRPINAQKVKIWLETLQSLAVEYTLKQIYFPKIPLDKLKETFLAHASTSGAPKHDPETWFNSLLSGGILLEHNPDQGDSYYMFLHAVFYDYFVAEAVKASVK